MVFNTTFNTILAILWRSVLLVEDNGVPANIEGWVTQKAMTQIYSCIFYVTYKLQIDSFKIMSSVNTKINLPQAHMTS